MKRFLESERWNEKTRMIAIAIVTGAILLFAMLFPLAFLQNAETEAPKEAATLDARSALFAEYWAAGDEQANFLAEVALPPDGAKLERCEALMAEIVAACIADTQLEALTPTGHDYVTISDGETDVNLCRMWMERKGDWRNWLDVCFDADSGEIYYLYLSCERLSNSESYAGYVQALKTHLSELLLRQAHGAVRYRNTEGENTEIAVVAGENGTVCYRIGGVAYHELIDVKITCF